MNVSFFCISIFVFATRWCARTEMASFNVIKFLLNSVAVSWIMLIDVAAGFTHIYILYTQSISQYNTLCMIPAISKFNDE